MHLENTLPSSAGKGYFTLKSKIRSSVVNVEAVGFSETSRPINHHYMTSHSKRPCIHRRLKFTSRNPTGTLIDLSDGFIRGFRRGADDY